MNLVGLSDSCDGEQRERDDHEHAGVCPAIQPGTHKHALMSFIIIISIISIFFFINIR